LIPIRLTKNTKNEIERFCEAKKTSMLNNTVKDHWGNQPISI